MDDVSTEERRGYALDMLRYMRISGFDLVSSGNKNNSLAEVSAHTCTSYICMRTYVHVCIDVIVYVMYIVTTCTFSTSPGKAVCIVRSSHCNSLTNFSNSCLRVSTNA